MDERFDNRDAGEVVLYLGHQLTQTAPHSSPHAPHPRDVAEDEEGGQGDGQQRDEGEAGVEDEQHSQHGTGNDYGDEGLGNTVGDKILHGLHVVDGASHEIAGAALVEKAVRHPLQMAVHPNHEPVHDLIGRHVRVQTVPIAHQAPDQVRA